MLCCMPGDYYYYDMVQEDQRVSLALVGVKHTGRLCGTPRRADV